MPDDQSALDPAGTDEWRVDHDDRASLLYALALGFGETDDPRERAFVRADAGLHTVPTLPSALLVPAASPVTGSPPGHVAERTTLYRPLPAVAELIARRQSSGRDDDARPGQDLTEVETELRLARDNTVIASCWRTYATSDGTGSPANDDVGRPAIRERAADFTHTLETRPTQAVLYALFESLRDGTRRLQPAPRPGALPELFVQGLACRALLATICDYDFTLIESFDLRFTGTLVAGESLVTDMWQDGNVVTFRCTVAERDTVIADAGRCTLRG